ncbi:type II toxin-antitoxin system VapB family antitoxin [Neorhizobium sp. DAR64861/K0K2]|uniref:type II toxin-antitoxin system VapB family antitoxin n=1 Tax=unclassified Neorhizobium TaxID=2629175 RepID=UPI003D2B4CD9
MEQGAVFQSNRSQAIRLPKAVALPDDVKRVDIIALGRTRIIAPAGEIWDSWFEEAAATSDFMSEREQPGSQEREAL